MALLRWHPAREPPARRADMSRLIKRDFGRPEGRVGTGLAGARAPPMPCPNAQEIAAQARQRSAMATSVPFERSVGLARLWR
jgi:hypothetical protein